MEFQMKKKLKMRKIMNDNIQKSNIKLKKMKNKILLVMTDKIININILIFISF